MEIQINNPTVDWVLLKDQFPEEERLVITWSDKTSSYRICKYMKSLTWKGYKLKLINLMSKGMWDEDATHWVYFPKPPSSE